MSGVPLSRRDIATRLIILNVLAERVKTARELARAEALKHFDRVGVRDIAEIGPDQIGSVQLANGNVTAALVDEAKFAAWVRVQHPEEIEMVTRPRSAFTERVLAQVRSTGYWLVEATGETLTPPGVIRRTGDPQLRVVPSVDATETIAAAITEGRMFLPGVLELEGKP